MTNLLYCVVFSLIFGAFATPSGLFKGYNEIPINRLNDDHEKHPDLDKLYFGNKAFVSINPKNEIKSEYWLKNGKDFVEQQINRIRNTNKAKNVIFFLGDGMSMVFKNYYLLVLKFNRLNKFKTFF